MGKITAALASSVEGANSLLWFRKGLRLHDNPALHAALAGAQHVTPVFCLDPWFMHESRVGINRYQFLLEALQDLDASLKARGSQLVLLRGPPVETIAQACKDFGITRLCWEADTEPYAIKRDTEVKAAAEAAGITVASPVGHTLYDSAELIKLAGMKMPTTMQGFQALAKKAGPPPQPLPDAPAQLPPVHPVASAAHSGIPSAKQLGYKGTATSAFKGGESVALARLAEQLSDKAWVAAFEKPKGNPALFDPPATTVLSPYLKMGCLSVRLFHSKLMEIYSSQPKFTKPPVSLEGQLLWREFFYTVGYATENFDRMVGNANCRQIDWDENEAFYAAWEAGRTGYPFVDAIMRQLNETGWMHHLARHMVACFLTRGDLYLSWERGRDTFDRLLIDGDHFINNGNWQWLSCSAFFSQFFRVYSPITFGKKYKAEKYIRRFVPELKDVPDKFIYEPYTMTVEQQRKANCIIGKDYPRPIVDHKNKMEDNMKRIKAAFAADKAGKPPSTPAKRSLGSTNGGIAPAKKAMT